MAERQPTAPNRIIVERAPDFRVICSDAAAITVMSDEFVTINFYTDTRHIAAFGVEANPDGKTYRAATAIGDRHLRVESVALRMTLGEAASLAALLMRNLAQHAPNALNQVGLRYEEEGLEPKAETR